MLLYVGALAVVFLAQSGVTAFIQAPAKRASRTRATWGGASKNDAAKHLAGPVGWDLGDDALGWAASKDDGGVGGPSDDPTPSTNLSDGDDVVCPAGRVVAQVPAERAGEVPGGVALWGAAPGGPARALGRRLDERRHAALGEENHG